MKLFRIKFASLLIATLLSCFVFMSPKPANALVAGCDPNKFSHMQDRATLQVGNDLGASQEIIKKMDTVIALTCWPEAAQISANEGGAIFSGGFEAELNNVISDMVDELLNQFVGSFLESFGTLGGIIGGWFGFGGPGSFNCTHMQDMWDDVVTRGINQSAEFLDVDGMIATALGGGSASSFIDDNLGAIAPVAANIQAVITAPPTPIPNFTGANTICEVQFRNTGAMPPGCP